MMPGWEFDEQAFLQKIPYPVMPTNLKGAYAGVAPPDDFDPNTASPSELIKNGILWRRPSATDPPALRAAWDKVFSRKWLAKDRVVPVLEPQVGRKHILTKPLRKISDDTYSSGSWSGAYVNIGGPFWGCAGMWRVPTVSNAPQSPSGNLTYDYLTHVPRIAYDSASWVGIDGAPPGFPPGKTNDVLQAGVEQYVDTTGKAYYVPFYEWYVPGGPPPKYVNQANITTFPVSAGDEVLAYVNYVGKTAGQIYVGNNTTGKHFSLLLAHPRASGDSDFRRQYSGMDHGGPGRRPGRRRPPLHHRAREIHAGRVHQCHCVQLRQLS
jgi:hypothetical protein